MRLKLVLSFLFLVFSFLFAAATAGTANAQSTNRNYINANPDVPQNLHTYTQSVFIEIAAAISCQLSGVDPTNPNGKCLGIDAKTGKIGFVEGGGGAIGLAGNFIAATFYIPVNTHDYVSNLASNFGIAKKTYAQETGIGFNALQPTMKLWQAFRNIVYMLFVILFVIVGLGIMFRIKIDPRTVMTLQNQIPKIIIALVLVTFSYAMAGFLVDMMYVSLYLIISIFSQPGIGIDSVNVTSSTPFGAVGGIGGMSGIASGAAGSVAGIVRSMFDGMWGKALSSLIGGIIGRLLGGGGLTGLVTTTIGAAFGVFTGGWLVEKTAWLIAYLVIIIALFSALLRLWFVLIKSYIYVLITVVFAPFYIAYGLIPGKSGFGNWIKSMVANLAVFPVTITMFLLGKAFIAGFTSKEGAFAPPMVGNFSNPEQFASIIGLGIILMTPEVANMVRDTLKAPDLKYTSAIGKSLSIGPAATGRFASGITSTLFGSHVQYVPDTSRGAAAGAVRLANVGPVGKFFRGFGFMK